RQFSEAANAVFGELQVHFLSQHKRVVLLCQRSIGVAQNSNKVVRRKRVKLDTDGESTLKFGNQVGRARQMERTGRDEEDMVGAHHPIFRIYRGALDQGKKVALHTLTGDIAAAMFLARGDLVDFIEEDDAV